MPDGTMKSGGSPAPRPAKNLEGETANSLSARELEIVNSVSDLLARTIACQPPNEARIRGLAA
ncbi:MAG: hypothetical protein GX625_21800 [Clostridiaceae bacterium]|jgi:hypothetical protein|nr:hypothetical protein [Clostridiaceae bacterium]